MVVWTDSECSTIADVWGKVNVNEVGPQALARVLIVYPWTRQYFDSFGDLSDADAILANARVAAHGRVICGALDQAVRHMEDIKGPLAELSLLHSEKHNVDISNFKLLFDCLIIVFAVKFGDAFSPQVQATWQKFLAAVVEALTSPD